VCGIDAVCGSLLSTLNTVANSLHTNHRRTRGQGSMS
jgi:hypothetical protein